MFLFENLIAYKKSVETIVSVYELTKTWPKTETFALIDQIKRSTSSVALNIAEGSSRTKKDFHHFLVIARGSCYESVAILNVAMKLGYITETQYKSFYGRFEELARIIQGLAKTLI